MTMGDEKSELSVETCAKLRAELVTVTNLAKRLQKELDEARLDLEIWKPASVDGGPG